MNEEQIKEAVIQLLYDLYNFNKLNCNVLDSISKHFNVNAYDLCEDNGITYFLN